MSSSQYEEKQFAEIVEWENQEPSVGQSMMAVVTAPISWLVEKTIPQAAIEGVLDASNAVAKWATDTDDVLRDGGVHYISELRDRQLEKCDDLANNMHNWAIGIAATDGAIAGAAGLPGMIVEMPIIITFATRTVLKIGLCYGFEAKTEQDMQFVHQILAAASSNTMSEKAAATIALRTTQTILLRETWKVIAQGAIKGSTQRAAIMATRELAKQLGINLTKRAALKAIPIIGGVIGAAVNIGYLTDVGWAARRAFQRLWLMKNRPDLFNDMNE